MKRIYVCSPYKGQTLNEITENKQYAATLTRACLVSGNIPVTPHLYLTAALDDNNVQERQIGLNAGIELLKTCDEIIIGADKGISAGMRAEIEIAVECKIPMSLASTKSGNVIITQLNAKNL